MSCHTVSPDDSIHANSVDTVRNYEVVAKEVTVLDNSEKVEDIKDRESETRETQEEILSQEEPTCRVCDPIDEEIDEEVEEEAEAQRPLRDPGMPNKNEILEHNLTHIPPRPWCPHCVRGKGKDSPSLRLTGQYAENLVPRIRLDYCFLTENDGGEIEEHDGGNIDEAQIGSKQTVLVMQESECRSVWAYAVDRKGASEEWAIHQICEDLETVGLKDDRIIAKEDQEPSIVDVAREIARHRGGRFGTAIDNSRVGDSDSNGTIE